MSRTLPDRPNLDHLKKQAKELLHAFQQGDAEAAARFRALASTSPSDGGGSGSGSSSGGTSGSAGAGDSGLKLADAHHVIAHEYGFASWPALKAHVESLARPFDPLAALTAAVRGNETPAVRRLLAGHPALKARIDKPLPNFNFGSTALLGAVQKSNREMIDILLDAGADINVKSDWWAGGFGVLDSTSRDLAPYLIARGARLEPSAAAKLGMFDELKAMITARPELVHARGGDGQMPLHLAATVEIAAYLLEQGAAIDARDVDHESTPAQYAVRERQDVARYLVSRGCWTDILMAAALGDRALVERHLDEDPTSIRRSVSDRYFPKQNFHAGGTIYIWTLGSHKTAHRVARDFHHEDIFRLLIDRSPDELQLALACEVGEEALVARILDRRPAIASSLSDDDRRRLVHAAQNNETDAVRLMLAAGWPADTHDAQHVTPLHWAAFHGNADMARDLLRYKPPLELKDDTFHATPLGWGIHGSEHGWHPERGNYPGVVEALLQAGAIARPVTEDLDASEPVRAVLRRYSKP